LVAPGRPKPLADDEIEVGGTAAASSPGRVRKHMEYRRPGSRGLKVSEIALGSWLTYGDYVEDRIAAECVIRALELGVNMFDTANSYADGAPSGSSGGR
jgi:hypothetical protein